MTAKNEGWPLFPWLRRNGAIPGESAAYFPGAKPKADCARNQIE